MAVTNYNSTEKIFLSEGAFLISVGLITVYFSQVTQLAFLTLFSIGLFFIGLYKLINAIVMRRSISTPFLSIISAILLILSGVYLMFNPLVDSLFPIIGTVLYLLMESLISFAAAVDFAGQKPVLLIGIFTGLVQAALAAAVFLSAPFYALWISALALGINFIFAGILYITKYSYSKKLVYCTC